MTGIASTRPFAHLRHLRRLLTIIRSIVGPQFVFRASLLVEECNRVKYQYAFFLLLFLCARSRSLFAVRRHWTAVRVILAGALFLCILSQHIMAF